MSLEDLTLPASQLFRAQDELIEFISSTFGLRGALFPRRYGTSTAIARYCAMHPQQSVHILVESQRASDDMQAKLDSVEAHNAYSSIDFGRRVVAADLLIVDEFTWLSSALREALAGHNEVFLSFNPIFTPKQFAKLTLGGTGFLYVRVPDVPGIRKPSDAVLIGSEWSWRRDCEMGVDLEPLLAEQRALVGQDVRILFQCHTISHHLLDNEQTQHLLQILTELNLNELIY